MLHITMPRVTMCTCVGAYAMLICDVQIWNPINNDNDTKWVIKKWVIQYNSFMALKHAKASESAPVPPYGHLLKGERKPWELPFLDMK